MSAEQLATRLLSEEARISGDRIRRGDIGQKDFDRFVQVSREIPRCRLQIDDTPAITLSALRTRCRRLKRTKGLALVVVDYLQLMRPAAGHQAGKPGAGNQPDHPGPEGDRQGTGGSGAGAVAALARGREPRGQAPATSDLRESGSIEQDADMVMFIYRDEYYLEQRMPKEIGVRGAEKFQAPGRVAAQMEQVHNKADLIIAKQRHGPTGTIQLLFEGEFTRFADLDLVHSDHVGLTLPAILTIDLGRDRRQLATLRARHSSGAVGAVVKADGYGLGARRVARLLRRRVPALLRRLPG